MFTSACAGVSLSAEIHEEEVIMRLGIDVGSTTVKLVLLDDEGKIVYSRYERHMSNVFETVADMLKDLHGEMGELEVHAVITGSGGLSLSKLLGLHF